MNLSKEQLQTMITQAHMAGQMYNGCKHPSYGDAVGYYSNEVLKNLPNEPKTVSNNEQKMKSCVTCRYGSLPCCNHCIGCIDHSKHTT